MDKQYRQQRGHAGTSDKDGERNSQVYDSHRSAHLLSLRGRKHFDHDKARNKSRADQRLLPKRGAGKSQIVVCDVRDRVRNDRSTAHGKKECNCEMGDPLHLYSPHAVAILEDGFDDTDRSMTDSIRCSRNEGILKRCLDRGCQEKPVRALRQTFRGGRRP